MLVSVVTVPLAVHYLGPEEYGIWVTVSGTTAMVAALDLGLASTLTNFIAKAGAENDKESARRYFSTAFWVSAVLAALLACALAYLLHFVHWKSLLHVSSDSVAVSARWCVLIAGLYGLAGLPLNLVTRALAGYQQVHKANYFSMANSVLTLISVAGGILLHFSLIGLMLTYCGLLLSGMLALNVWVFWYSKPWVRPSPRVVNRGLVRDLFRQGIPFFLIQICNIVVFNSDNLVITHYLGADKVTPYSLAWKLITYITLLQQFIMPATWPALTDAYHRGDRQWVRSTYRSIAQKSFFCIAVLAFLFGIFGGTIVRLWVGPVAVPDAPLMWLMALWAIVVCYTSNQSMLLVAMGRLRVQTYVAVGAALVNLPLSIFLVQRIGSHGVILATIISFVTVMLLPQQREVRLVLAHLEIAGEPLKAGT